MDCFILQLQRFSGFLGQSRTFLQQVHKEKVPDLQRIEIVTFVEVPDGLQDYQMERIFYTALDNLTDHEGNDVSTKEDFALG